MAAEYLYRAADFVHSAGGKCELGRVGTAVSRSSTVTGSLKSLLQRDHRFTLAAANGTGYTVHLVSLTAAGSHKFQAISLHVTFRFMVKMKNLFESRPWPSHEEPVQDRP